MARFEKCRHSINAWQRAEGRQKKGRNILYGEAILLLLFESFMVHTLLINSNSISQNAFHWERLKDFLEEVNLYCAVGGARRGSCRWSPLGLWQNKKSCPSFLSPCPSWQIFFSEVEVLPEMFSIFFRSWLNSSISSFSVCLQTHICWSNVTQSFDICPNFSKD